MNSINKTDAIKIAPTQYVLQFIQLKLKLKQTPDPNHE